MGIVVVPSFGADPVSITGPGLDAKVDGLATEFNGSIDNDNLDASAAIANSKLNLASIAQNVAFAGTVALNGVNTVAGVTTMSSKIFKMAKGADVASAAGNIALGDDGNYFDITGTEAITSITAKAAGTVVVLQFDSTASLVDGSNLKLAGNFTGAAESQIMLSSDGTNWFEVSRSPLTIVSAASQSDQETGTSTTTYVSPGRQQFHPSAAKAWCNFDGTGTPAMTTSYNFDSSITDNGTGDYTLTFTTDFSAASMCVIGIAGGLAGNSPMAGVGPNVTTGIGAATVRILVFRSSSEVGLDTPVVCLAAFGDQ